jgi:hypothetical protein
MTRTAWIIVAAAIALLVYLEWSTAGDGSAAAQSVLLSNGEISQLLPGMVLDDY